MKSIFVGLLLVFSVPTAWATGDVVGDKELVQRLYDSKLAACDRLGVTPQHLQNLLRILKAEIRAQVLAGKEVRLAHFGTFFQGHVPAYTATNPQTGEAREISARDIVQFEAHDPSISWGEYIVSTR